MPYIYFEDGCLVWTAEAASQSRNFPPFYSSLSNALAAVCFSFASFSYGLQVTHSIASIYELLHIQTSSMKVIMCRVFVSKLHMLQALV